ncbi:hypothetical protein [Homoserinimonas sp. A520]
MADCAIEYERVLHHSPQVVVDVDEDAALPATGKADTEHDIVAVPKYMRHLHGTIGLHLVEPDDPAGKRMPPFGHFASNPCFQQFVVLHPREHEQQRVSLPVTGLEEHLEQFGKGRLVFGGCEGILLTRVQHRTERTCPEQESHRMGFAQGVVQAGEQLKFG